MGLYCKMYYITQQNGGYPGFVVEIEYLKHSLEGRTLYERQIISLSKPSMISANAWVESHVAYHSLEGRPQMIGSFITPYQGSLNSATAATRPGRTCCVLRPGRACSYTS